MVTFRCKQLLWLLLMKKKGRIQATLSWKEILWVTFRCKQLLLVPLSYFWWKKGRIQATLSWKEILLDANSCFWFLWLTFDEKKRVHSKWGKESRWKKKGKIVREKNLSAKKKRKIVREMWRERGSNNKLNWVEFGCIRLHLPVNKLNIDAT